MADPPGTLRSKYLIIPAVTTLPTSGEEGEQVDYFPSGLSVRPQWRCTWRQALNGGNGAWSVQRARPLTSVFRGTNRTTSVPSGYALVPVTSTPTLTVPVSGLYELEVVLPVQLQTGVLADLFIGLQRTTGELLSWMEYFVTDRLYQSAMTGSRTEDLFLTSGWVTRICLAGGTAASWLHSGSVPTIVKLHPTELRP